MTTTALALYRCGSCDIWTETRSEMNAHKVTPEHAAKRAAEAARIVAEWDAVTVAPRVPREVALSEPEKDRFSGERTDLPVRPRQAAPVRSAVPSEKSLAFLRTLLSERSGDLVDGIRLGLNSHREARTLTQGIVSNAIDALKEIPRNVAAKPEGPGTMDFSILDHLPAGRYLVGETYVKVDRPKNGTYEGFVFVKRQPYGPDTDGVRVAMLNPKAKTAKVDEGYRSLLETLLADPYAHALKYAQTTEHCGICGRGLKVKESIERGIGPVCAAKFGRTE